MGKKLNDETRQRPKGDRMLDAPLLTIDLPACIKEIKKEKKWKKSDQNAITVFKTNGLSIVLIAMRKSADMIKHSADGIINIQVLEGKILLNTDEQSIGLSKGQLLALHKGIPHSIRAKKKSLFLLTLTKTWGENNGSLNVKTVIEQHTLNEKSEVGLAY